MAPRRLSRGSWRSEFYARRTYGTQWRAGRAVHTELNTAGRPVDTMDLLPGRTGLLLGSLRAGCAVPAPLLADTSGQAASCSGTW